MRENSYRLMNLGLLFVLLLTSAACKKYEDGPWFSMYSKKERTAGNWQFALVRIDGVDKTEEYASQAINLTKGGSLFWRQGYSGWDTYGIGGTWKFVSNKDQIEMHFVEGVKEEITLIWDITRMAYADLQLARYEDGKKIEWQLWKHY
jgi:hypothetical protein